MTILLGLFNLILAAIYHYIAFQFQVTGDRTDGLVANVLKIAPPLLAVASFFVPTFWRLIFTGVLLVPCLESPVSSIGRGIADGAYLDRSAAAVQIEAAP